MYIFSVSVKGSYGWKTVAVDQFMHFCSISERLSMVSDPAVACCVNEFGEVIETEQASKLLRWLEAHNCVSASECSLFLKVYTHQSKDRVLVEQKLAAALEAEEKPK